MNLMGKILGPVGVMPSNQLNAILPDDLVMRVGVPHRGGELALHAHSKGYAAMVSANAFFDAKNGTFKIPDVTVLNSMDFSLDSAGFTAMQNWKSKGTQAGIASIFPWRLENYISFASQMNPSWWAQPDLCCEKEIAADQAEIDWRVKATGTLLFGTLQILYEWQKELSKDTHASTIEMMLRPPVPVLQGRRISQYVDSLEMMLEVWNYWASMGDPGSPWLAPPALIGVGSVCRRDLNDPEDGLFAILEGLEGKIPQGSKLHLFGVKGSALKKVKMLPFVASCDSMAYDFGARIEARERGISNNMEHRTTVMTRWMDTAGEMMRAKAGDQFRLDFHA